MQGWDTFSVVIGAAAASLIGLLFVAVSIRIDVIGTSIELRNRAAQTLLLLGTVLLVAIILALPGQPVWVVGVETIVLAIAVGLALQILDRRAGHGRANRIAHILDVVSPNVITCGLLAVGGVVLAFGLTLGLYVVVLAVVAAIIGGVVSAWLFLVRVAEPD